MFEAKIDHEEPPVETSDPTFFVAGLGSDGFSLSCPRESVSLLGKGCKVRLGAVPWKLSYD